MAHLKTKATRHNPPARQEWKFRLTRRLYEQGYERQDIINLFRFIDWILVLPDGLKQAFQSDLQQYEQERAMPYVTSIEQMAQAKGKAEGKAELALKMLQEGGTIEFVTKVTGFSAAQLQQLQADATT
jgi:predicted transposase/invertase (TIGR01784 family)